MTENNHLISEEGRGKLHQADKNRLFPVFLKLEQLPVLLVGGGNVGLEKLLALLQNAPASTITIVASKVSAAVRELGAKHAGITIVERPFLEADLLGKSLVIVAIDDKQASKQIMELAHRQKLLVNVADTPELCDFYLGSIVQKGSLKIAISTNGKSPTVAKRLKEVIAKMIPDEMEDVLENMQTLRNGEHQVKVLCGRKVSGKFVHPFCLFYKLTFRTMSVST
jgi:siroheme synthase-like protein